jgi:2-keto-myo-inositol isomerase
MPGEGIIDLGEIMQILKDLGYNEMVSIELFRPEYWDWPDEKNIKISYEKTVQTIKPYFG